ncbi:MAG: hypothetical protein ABWY68_02360 [Cryobacterium sp.]
MSTPQESTPTPNVEPDRAEQLATIVGSVPGVDELYPARPVLVGIVKEVIGALTQKPSTPDLVAVTESSAGVTASVSIGVEDVDAATEVCRRVYDTIEEYFVAAGDPAVAAIEVTVARIG